MNPTNSSTNEIKLAYTGDRLNDLYDVLDDVHTAASENELPTCTTMNENELLSLLKDLIYTAQETVSEIEKRSAKRNKTQRENVLQLVSLEALMEKKNA